MKMIGRSLLLCLFSVATALGDFPRHSASGRWQVTGQQYGYGFDNIGNRTNAQSGSLGNLRTTSYTANNLNEYTEVNTPGYKDILGPAIATNAVSVNGLLADRKNEYFHHKRRRAGLAGGDEYRRRKHHHRRRDHARQRADHDV